MEEKSLVKNAASSKQVKRAAEKEKWNREQHINDCRLQLQTVNGRRLAFYHVNIVCHYDTDDFNNSGSITFRSLGERNIGRILKADYIEADLELWQLAEKENWEYYKNQQGGTEDE